MPVVVAVLSLSLAGCVAPSWHAAEGPTLRGTTTSASSTETSEADRYPGRPVDAVLWQNGSLGPHETCVPVGCVVGHVTGNEPYQKTFDVTSSVPVSTPVSIEATLQWEGDGREDVYFFVTGEIRTYRHSTTYDWDHQRAHLRVTIVRPPGGTVRLSVHHTTPRVTPDVSADYSIRAHLQTDPTVVPVAVPTGVSVPEEADEIVLRSEGGASEVLLFGPDDRLVLRETIHAERRVPVNSTESAPSHVLYLLEDSAPVAVSTEPGPPNLLEAFQVKRDMARDHDAPLPGHNTTWGFYLDRVPLGVGLWAGAGRSDRPWVQSGIDGQVESPHGSVFSIRSDATAFGTGHASIIWYGLASTNLTTGRYEATVRTDVSVGSVGHIVVDYER